MTWWGFGRRPPTPTPAPVGPPALLTGRVTVRGPDGQILPETTATLLVDDGSHFDGVVEGERVTIRIDLPVTHFLWQATLTLKAPSYRPHVRKVLVGNDADHANPNLEWGDVVLERIVPAPVRLRAEGRRLRRSDGQPWAWQGLTSFRFVELVDAGRIAEAEALAQWAQTHDVTILRIFLMAGAHPGNGVPYLFHLDPARGLAALGRSLQILAAYGLYAEVVLLVDTAFFTFNHEQYVADAGTVLALHANAVGQCANEPTHSTQRALTPEHLAHLRAFIPSHVPVTLGPAHGADDWDQQFTGGDYVTVHFDRQDGEDHFTNDGAGLRWVRHIKDGLDTSETSGRYVVNDECRRNDLTPWKHFAVAVICRLLGLGDTFHYGGGLGAQIPTGNELAAFDARRRGWKALPMDWQGRFYNAGHAGSPVEGADWAFVLKVFSAVDGDVGYTLALGSPTIAPAIHWAPRWTRDLVAEEGGARLWRLTR